MKPSDASSAPKAADFVGREINVGDTLVYAVRGGSGLWLNKLKVTQVNFVGNKASVVGYNPGDSAQRRINIRNLHTTVVVA